MPHPSVDRSLTAIRFIAFSSWLGLLAAVGAWAQPVQPVPALVAPVIDTTGTLQAAQKAALEAKLGSAGGSKIVWRPKSTVPVSGEQAATLMKLLDGLDDEDDVQAVFTNFDISDEDMAKLSA